MDRDRSSWDHSADKGEGGLEPFSFLTSGMNLYEMLPDVDRSNMEAVVEAAGWLYAQLSNRSLQYPPLRRWVNLYDWIVEEPWNGKTSMNDLWYNLARILGINPTRLGLEGYAVKDLETEWRRTKGAPNFKDRCRSFGTADRFEQIRLFDCVRMIHWCFRRMREEYPDSRMAVETAAFYDRLYHEGVVKRTLDGFEERLEDIIQLNPEARG
jgi:hypothetical protein